MKIGAQTYTIRMHMQNENDFADSMKKIADIGYNYVQLSGLAPLSPTFIRKTCDECGLKIVLTHTSMDIVGDVESVIRYHQVLGCPYIGIGSGGAKYRTPEGAAQFGKDFYAPAKAMQDAGFKFMYHNHADEWGRLPNGQRILDVYLSAIPADLMGITLDFYWLHYTGSNALSWIEKLQDRLQCVHLKDMAIRDGQPIMAPIGEGNMDYPAIIEKLLACGKTEYALVEQDDCYGRDPFDCLKASYHALRSLGL